MKQTWNTNKKRQDVKFRNLVYLSSENIKFSKELACKLIPKYLGLYKMLQEHGSIVQAGEMPPHLKKRGVHNVVHSSLPWIHSPNDDRLVPEHMDMQIVGEDTWDNEWAVNHIKSYSGSKSEALFKIL